jgi:hypothetical protein
VFGFWSKSARPDSVHGCQIFLGPNVPKWEKIYQMTTNYTKLPYIVPNGHKILQMIITHHNIFHSKDIQNLPKLGFLVLKQTIWQPWQCYWLSFTCEDASLPICDLRKPCNSWQGQPGISPTVQDLSFCHTYLVISSSFFPRLGAHWLISAAIEQRGTYVPTYTAELMFVMVPHCYK